MQLSQLVAEIKDEINKGNSITDEQIKVKIRDALTLIELGEDWEYLDRFVTFSIDLDSAQPRALPIPFGLKSVEFMRFTDTNNNAKFRYVNEVSPRDVERIGTGLPEGYWKDGMEYFWLDNEPAEPYQGEMSYRKFTTWTDKDSFEPWIMQVAGPYVKYQTLVLMAPFMREPSLQQMWSPMLQQSRELALMMNEELRMSNTNNRMQYS